MHDVPEQYTGDIPAPVKWRSESIKHSLAWEEQNFITKHKLPNPQLSQDEYDLLKAADMLDFTFSSIEEVRRGNTYAERLVSVGRTYIMGLPLPPAVLEKALAMIKEVQEYEDVGL
jgi:5'-deoxynucleotidase YfbR-like HD superfamily hydrolase